MKFEASFLTDKGLRRESNQDACLINNELGLFIVADGMGGHSGGEVASSMAVEAVEEVMLSDDAKSKDSRTMIVKAYEEASRKIFDLAATERPELSGMGTTMVVAQLKGRTLYVGNVGDSRCYFFKKPYLWQITEDHSLINEQLRAGIMTPDQVRQFVGRNVITRSVGYERDVYPDIIERDVSPGEMFIICSDGLSSLVPDSQICEILNDNPTDKVVKACVEQALANGGDDNVTVLLLHIVE
jgi:serine/threonine protein phosphatase PrpC